MKNIFECDDGGIVMCDIRPIADCPFGYHAYADGLEIGMLRPACRLESKYLKIEYFCVRESYRRKSVGRSLMQRFLQDALQTGCFSEVNVYPYSEPYEGDSHLDSISLYQAYWKLGFRFAVMTPTDKRELSFDATIAKYAIDCVIPNHHMIGDIAELIERNNVRR